MASRKRFGTRTGGGIDMRRLGSAIAAPGIDLREWIGWGTVATCDGEDGEINYDDKHAIVLDPDGVDVDVILDINQTPITCHYFGLWGGPGVSVMAPIPPGTRVVVGCPSGDLSSPVILGAGNSRSQRLPMGKDRKTIWRNDRLLIHSETVPIDIRAAGAEVTVRSRDTIARITDKKIQLGGEAAEALFKGTSKWQEELALLQALLAAFTALQGATIGNLTSILEPGFVQAMQALQDYIAKGQKEKGWLSELSFTE